MEMEAANILKLPEGCISEILSLTSPRDACRSSAISSGFKSAVDSDAVWHRFLPSDYLEILARSDSPVVYSTKKQLYFLLCHSLVLLDGGKLRFMLDKKSGKKCYMLPSRELTIAWKDNEAYWKWPSIPGSRFTEVAVLRSVCWLDIRGKIETRMLSPMTTYAAYLVYKLAPNAHDCIGPVKTSVRFLGDEVEPEGTVVYLKEQVNRQDIFLRRRRVRQEPVSRLPHERTDGWLEIELGEFFSDCGEDGKVEISSAISSGFKSAADSDAVWPQFLPSDYLEVLARSDSPVVYSTKKQLYFFLCDSLVLLDGGKLVNSVTSSQISSLSRTLSEGPPNER
ncbi:hypothetical protein LguiB_013674 [Lonicera macranthoides]